LAERQGGIHPDNP